MNNDGTRPSVLVCNMLTPSQCSYPCPAGWLWLFYGFSVCVKALDVGQADTNDVISRACGKPDVQLYTANNLFVASVKHAKFKRFLLL